MATTVKAKVRETENSLNTTTRSAFVIAKKLEEFTDVNTASLEDGSILVYDLSRDEWSSTTQLSQQELDAGEF